MTVSEALQKLKDAVRVMHFFHATEKSYAMWLRLYMTVLRDFPAEWEPE